MIGQTLAESQQEMFEENTPCRVQNGSFYKVSNEADVWKYIPWWRPPVFIRIFKQKTQKLREHSSFGRDAGPLNDPPPFPFEPELTASLTNRISAWVLRNLWLTNRNAALFASEPEIITAENCVNDAYAPVLRCLLPSVALFHIIINKNRGLGFFLTWRIL